MRKAIVILGMHRSGTSMVSGILHRMGFDLGKHLWENDFANAKGYFENSQIGTFNDYLLELLHVNWHDTLLLPEYWWMDEKISNQIDHFEAIIKDEFAASSFLLLKDPRISILLPFYLLAFNKLHIRPSFILNFRDPFTVALSLKKRNNLAISKSLILWMDHTLKSELYTRDQNRIFIHYDQILANPFLFLEMIFHHFKLEYNPTQIQKSQIIDFVDTKLRHNSVLNARESSMSFIEAQSLYDHLCTLNGKSTNCHETVKFDKIGAAFYQKFKFFQGIDVAFEALLQIETINGIRKTVLIPIHLGYMQLNFTVECEAPVTTIILNPCNQKTGLILHTLLITDNQNEKCEIHPYSTNADWSDNAGTLVFESETPEITYFLSPPKRLDKIVFSLTYTVFAGTTHRYGIHERNHHIMKLTKDRMECQEGIRTEKQNFEAIYAQMKEQEVECKNTIESLCQSIKKIEEFKGLEISKIKILLAEKEKEVLGILQSYTWKTGKLIMFPIMSVCQLYNSIFKSKTDKKKC